MKDKLTREEIIDRIEHALEEDLYKELATKGDSLLTKETFVHYTQTFTREYADRYFEKKSDAIAFLKRIGCKPDEYMDAMFEGGHKKISIEVAASYEVTRLSLQAVTTLHNELKKEREINEKQLKSDIKYLK